MKSLALIASVMMLATGSANAQTPAVGQQTAAPKATQPASAASREVAAAAAAIVDAFGRHDPKKYFSLFAPDATFEKGLNKVLKLAAKMKRAMSQEAIAIQVNGDLFLL